MRGETYNLVVLLVDNASVSLPLRSPCAVPEKTELPSLGIPEPYFELLGYCGGGADWRILVRRARNFPRMGRMVGRQAAVVVTVSSISVNVVVQVNISVQGVSQDVSIRMGTAVNALW